MAADAPVEILRLHMPDGFDYSSGQYLEVIHPDGTRIPLSIASIPEQLPDLCLHYRSQPGQLEAQRFDELLHDAAFLNIEGPAGDVFLDHDDTSALLLIAGGTGISQAMSLAAAQCLRHPAARVRLLACVDHPQDLYFRDLLPVSACFEPVLLADPRRTEDNDGMRWLRENATPAGHERTILAGSPGFVYAVTETLLAAGFAEHQLESDVYAYMPR